MALKLIIAKDGFDAKTANPKDCSVHSDYPPPLLDPNNIGVNDYTVPASIASGRTNLFTIPHGYSFTPLALVFVRDDQIGSSNFIGSGVKGFFILPVSINDFNTGTFLWFDAYTDSTNLYIDIVNDSGGAITDFAGETYRFKHEIFALDQSQTIN